MSRTIVPVDAVGRAASADAWRPPLGGVTLWFCSSLSDLPDGGSGRGCDCLDLDDQRARDLWPKGRRADLSEQADGCRWGGEACSRLLVPVQPIKDRRRDCADNLLDVSQVCHQMALEYGLAVGDSVP